MTEKPPSPEDDCIDDGVPVIDMSASDETVAQELLNAFQTIGFATLINHSVESTTIQQAFRQSRHFFQLPTLTKLGYKFQGYESNRGYIGIGCESHEHAQPDKKETFDIGNEADEAYSNKWPLDDEFKTTMTRYFDAFDALHLKIMKLLAAVMKLDDVNYFVERCNERHENLRLLHYPALPRPQDQDQEIVRGAVHTDFGTLTLLTQDSVGGLRAQRLDGQWVHVSPVDNSIVVNVGDMLQRWSNDSLRATPHQVVELSSNDDGTMFPERLSIAFFCNANKNVMLDCLQQCQSEAPKYSPIKAHDYLIRRLSETISKEASA
jgi:isopenicillin N synthase-like dioxygenase